MVLYLYRNIIQKLVSPFQLLPQICKIRHIRSLTSVILLPLAFVEDYRNISLCDGKSLSFGLLAFFFVDLSGIVSEPLVEGFDEFRLMKQELEPNEIVGSESLNIVGDLESVYSWSKHEDPVPECPVHRAH